MAKHGFTLAEVLVTLGIIGVVSALTIPTLVKNHQRQVYVTQLQKVVNELSQAADKAITDSNAVSLDETRYGTNKANGASNFLNDYFKIVKDCGETTTPCFADSYENLSGNTVELGTPIIAVSLASGASISIYTKWYWPPYYDSGDGTIVKEDCHSYYTLQVDVNGAQGPNIAGRDLFTFDLYSDGKVADGYDNSNRDFDYERQKCINPENFTGYSGAGCLNAIINDGWKMDY